MDKFSILEEIYPQVKEMKKVPPNTHHHLDLFHHVVETVRNIEILYEESSKKEKEHLDSIDFGIYITTTKAFQKHLKNTYGLKWEGSLSFEKVTRYLPHIRSAIQVPIYVIGIDI